MEKPERSLVDELRHLSTYPGNYASYICGLAAEQLAAPIHAAGACYCHECAELRMENMTSGTEQPFTEEAFFKARSKGEFVMLRCNLVNQMRGLKDFCSRGYKREDA